MPGIDRCAGPEQMPPLEPLTEPNGEVSSLHDLSAVPPLLSTTSPSLSSDSSPSPPKRRFHHDMRQFMKELMAMWKLSLVLENKGNVARDHLASERTYLAYVRTSLATASAGVGAYFAACSTFNVIRTYLMTMQRSCNSLR